MLQKALSQRERHVLFLSTMFGDLVFKRDVGGTGKLQHVDGSFRTPPQFDSGGGLSATANPWLRQIQADLNLLRRIEAADLFWGVFEASGLSVRALVLDDCVRAAFLDLDVRQVRPTFLANTVPPPGLETELLQPRDHYNSDEEGVFTCKFAGCAKSYPSFQQLSMHLSRAHRCRTDYNQAVVTNQCPVCKVVLSSIPVQGGIYNKAS